MEDNDNNKKGGQLKECRGINKIPVVGVVNREEKGTCKQQGTETNLQVISYNFKSDMCGQHLLL